MSGIGPWIQGSQPWGGIPPLPLLAASQRQPECPQVGPPKSYDDRGWWVLVMLLPPFAPFFLYMAGRHRRQRQDEIAQWHARRAHLVHG